ncbi:MAG TPA: 7-carboxy-7-deazaguanine synthase [Gemmatimonadales bacterium]|nr:7-carboxy-7-deazaguanine synthase [Gemmatimonadales bacterium]
MSYAIKSLFYTLQGEGHHTGRPAVFLRFAGCNLWSGLERDRARAVCRFCDTDFVGTDGEGGGRFRTAELLADAVAAAWPAGGGPWPANRAVGERQFVVCTGGEPLLQLDQRLITALRERGFEIAVETNGTLPVPRGVDWVCVSPKAGAPLVQREGDELKLVYPQDGAEPQRYAELRFTHFFLQPMDGPDVERNTALAAAYVASHPRWRLSIQTHKLLGIP